ncbi:hypothetical protein COOONC_21375 [Cooperia oncophora]
MLLWFSCQNYGMNVGGRCVCAPGYYSKYCESRGFRPAVEYDIDLSSRSLVMIFSLRSSMYDDFQSFKANLPNMTAGIAGPENSISSYVFWGFIFTEDGVMTYYVGYGTQLKQYEYDI